MNRINQIALGVVVLIVIGSGVVLATRRTSTTTTSSNQPARQTSQGQSSTNSSHTSISTSTVNSSTSSSSIADIGISANDSNASQTAITVSKGTKVNLTFHVDSDGVYHGGLQFKSTNPAIDTGPIKPGDFKTVSFTADKSFSFTPYWYASGVKKDYLITVTVP